MALVFFDDLSAQQMDIILNAMNTNTMRMVITIAMKYGVASCELETIKVSAEGEQRDEREKMVNWTKASLCSLRYLYLAFQEHRVANHV